MQATDYEQTVSATWDVDWVSFNHDSNDVTENQISLMMSVDKHQEWMLLNEIV